MNLTDIPPDLLPGEFNHGLVSGGLVDEIIKAQKERRSSAHDFFGEKTVEILALVEHEDPLKEDFGAVPVHTRMGSLPKSVQNFILYNTELLGYKTGHIQQVQFFPMGYRGAIALAGVLQSDVLDEKRKKKFREDLQDEFNRLREYFILYNQVYMKVEALHEAVEEAIEDLTNKGHGGDPLDAAQTAFSDKKEQLEAVRDKAVEYKKELKTSHAPTKSRLKEMDQKLDKKLKKVKEVSPPTAKTYQENLQQKQTKTSGVKSGLQGAAPVSSSASSPSSSSVSAPVSERGETEEETGTGEKEEEGAKTQSSSAASSVGEKPPAPV